MRNQINEPQYRHELKYLVTEAQIAVLRARINGIMKPDPHVTASGKYNIRSLYFDDYDNSCFWDNENGTDPREKYRIRIYNQSKDRITLERKRKERGKTLKRSCPITEEQTVQLMQGGCVRGISNAPPLLQQLCEENLSRQMKPVIIVEYERIPYVYSNGNVRVTFDTRIASSNALGQFFKEVIPKRAVLPVGMQLLEVKFDEYLPDVIYHALQLDNLQQTAFSKYYLCRKYSL